MTFLRKFNIKDMKMGALVKFLHAMQFEQSLSNLTSVFHTIQVCLCVCVCMCVCVFYMYQCMCVCICVCVYIYI